MALTRQRMFELSAARDRHYDGRFLIGVLSTGIYCLPSCPARRPKPENVRFFHSPEAAVDAGLRACKRCRPELFYQQRDPDREVLEETVRRVRREPESFADVEALAAATGFGRSKLHRLLRRHYHQRPAALLLRARLEQTKRQLVASKWSVLDVGLAAGFDSASAFHDNFVRATGLSPGAYRRMTRGHEFVLQLPRDFHDVGTWRYLGRDDQQATERVEAGRAWRALRIGRRDVLVEIEQRGLRLRAAVTDGKESPAILPPEGMAEVHARLWRWLGLESDVAGFERKALRHPRWRELVHGQRGLRLAQTPSVFESLVWAIVGQQVNLAFAYRLRAVLVDLCSPRGGGGPRRHPTPGEVARLDAGDLTARQFSRSKAEYVLGAARWAIEKPGRVEGLRDLPATTAASRLETLRGVGPWTEQYVLMRGCGFADCVPVGDAGLVKALRRFESLAERPDADETRHRMRVMAPHRSLATAHLWASLAGDDTQEEKGNEG